MMFDDELATFASETVRQFADAKFRIASAESLHWRSDRRLHNIGFRLICSI